MTVAITWVVIGLIALAVLIIIMARFYERSNREISLVKTGIGGRKVVMDGGTIVIPYFHEVSRVNMQTLLLEVRRTGEAALITKDRLRVDVGVTFYVSVIASSEGVARASQTLGNRTFNPEKLRELIEGMLVNALHTAAAQVTMDELHENRGAFVADVRDSLGETLARHGLELDSVSLTALDQTPFRTLDENNAFNAVGLRKLAAVIATSKKERAEIDADADVSVRRAAMEANKRKLLIDLEEQEAEIAQVQQIETLRAAQLSEVIQRKAASERESALARIQMEQDIRAADIARERDIEIANQDRRITLSRKSQEESQARGEADTARAEAVRAEETILTARQVAEAERRREIAVLAARQEGQIQGTRIRMTAEAEKDAATDRGKAKLEEAKADAAALEVRAEATRKSRLAEAEGQRALIDAENTMENHIVAMKVALARLETLPELVAEMVKPAEKIESIKIHHISGLGVGQGGQSGRSGRGEASQKPVVNQALDSILEMAVQLPALKKIGEELGLSLEGGLDEVIRRHLAKTMGDDAEPSDGDANDRDAKEK